MLGLGTAMVYPTLLAIGDVAHPSWRASAVGVYRLWRELGYALEALIAGVVADLFGLSDAAALVDHLLLGLPADRFRLRDPTPFSEDRRTLGGMEKGKKRSRFGL